MWGDFGLGVSDFMLSTITRMPSLLDVLGSDSFLLSTGVKKKQGSQDTYNKEIK